MSHVLNGDDAIAINFFLQLLDPIQHRGDVIGVSFSVHTAPNGINAIACLFGCYLAHLHTSFSSARLPAQGIASRMYVLAEFCFDNRIMINAHVVVADMAIAVTSWLVTVFIGVFITTIIFLAPAMTLTRDVMRVTR